MEQLSVKVAFLLKESDHLVGSLTKQSVTWPTRPCLKVSSESRRDHNLLVHLKETLILFSDLQCL